MIVSLAYRKQSICTSHTLSEIVIFTNVDIHFMNIFHYEYDILLTLNEHSWYAMHTRTVLFLNHFKNITQ